MFNRLMNSRFVISIGFWAITGVLVVASFWVITFVYQQTQAEDEELGDVRVEDQLSPIYVDYYARPWEYVSDESYLAMGRYAGEFAQTQNVEVLTDLSTVEITGYMLNHMSAGLGVDCTYCHSLDNFAADVWDDEVAMANKNLSRQHLRMTADLNQNWLPQLAGLTDQRQPSGSQISCATCHNGVAVPEPWPEQGRYIGDLRLPLGEDVVYSVEEIGVLNVNARDDVSLDDVQYNQRVMYHMNDSLGVGCTHCHNSRYFPSYEVPAKFYTINMLQMSQYLWQEWSVSLRGSEPSCLMCHQGAAIPPGAVRSASLMPDTLVADPAQDE